MKLAKQLAPSLVAAVLVVWAGAHWSAIRASRAVSDGNAMSMVAPRDWMAGRPEPPSAAAVTPMQARERDILTRRRGTSSDPELAARYADINQAHFGGQLAPVAVAWDEALTEVGALIGDGFTLEGLTDGRIILLNPQLQAQPAALQRALCHEMVHVYLFGLGGDRTSHGPQFQQTLRRLSEEGAFEGIPSSEQEKSELRRILSVESARLDQENTALTTLREQIEVERQSLDSAVQDLNARMAKANDQQSDWPTDGERQAVERSRSALNERVSDYNARVERQRDAVAAFNGDVQRYTLMAAYPDGLDADTIIPAKNAPLSASSRTAAR